MTAPLPKPVASVDMGGRALRGDLIAGATVAVMLVPQGMAYALLAGLPPVAGLYAALVPLFAYAWLGTSAKLAVGPVALVSLMTGTAVAALQPDTPQAALALAGTLAALVGAIHLILGLLRLGSLVRFLTPAVISGFTSAAALLIAASQLGNLLGIPLERGPLHRTMASLFVEFRGLDPATALIGGLGIIGLVALKRWRPALPGALVAVILSSAVVAVSGLDVSVIGAVPSGLPTLVFPGLDSALGLLPAAATIALVVYLQSISVARAFQGGEPVSANREFFALGAANVAASLFGAYPVSGGLARTAVNARAGAETRRAGLVTALGIGLTLSLLTPLFRWVPLAILAAIIVTAVVRLVEISEGLRLARTDRAAALQWLVTFALTLTVSVEIGLAAGIAAVLGSESIRSAGDVTAAGR